MRTEFASGAWIEHRPIQALKYGDRDAYDAAVRVAVTFDGDGRPNVGESLSMGLAARQRNALIARLISAWSFTTDGGDPLPVPAWEHGEITDEASIGEIPLGDADELERWLAPFLAAVRRRPDPKEATTSSSNGSSPAKAHGSRRA